MSPSLKKKRIHWIQTKCEYNIKYIFLLVKSNLHQLPIYQVSNKEDDTGLDVPYPRNAVEEQIGNVRQTIQSFFTQYKVMFWVCSNFWFAFHIIS